MFIIALVSEYAMSHFANILTLSFMDTDARTNKNT